MMTERTCQTCKYGGCDPDGPYCAHPDALKQSGGFGLSLASLVIAKLCRYPEHPLFTPYEKKEASDENDP